MGGIQIFSTASSTFANKRLAHNYTLKKKKKKKRKIVLTSIFTNREEIKKDFDAAEKE